MIFFERSFEMNQFDACAFLQRVVRRYLLAVLVVCAVSPSAIAATQAVGEIALAKGVVTARSDTRAITALAKGSPVYQGDIIETADRSFAVIKFLDDGKVTLRPESRFDIHEYSSKAGAEKQAFELVKGGLRAVTGAIGKARPDNVKFVARNTTIGIRGTTFVIRLCREGTEGCSPPPSVGAAQLERDNELVDIFIVDKKTNVRRQITRRELTDILIGVYVSLIEGAIRLSTDKWYVDMTAGDKCLVDRDDRDIECYLNGPGLEENDPFLDDRLEFITQFNLFGDEELFVGQSICIID